MPGGIGHSWFILKLDTVQRMGSSWVVLTLDTQGPRAIFDHFSGVNQGSTLSFTYTADEIVSAAYLVNGANRLQFEGDVGFYGELHAPIPGYWPPGPSTIELVDLIGNVAAYVGAVTFPGVVEPPTPTPPLPPAPFFPTELPIAEIAKARLKGELVQARLKGEIVRRSGTIKVRRRQLVEARTAGTIVRAIRVEARAADRIQLVERAEVSVRGVRAPATLLLQQIREDEEILAVLAVLS